MKTKRLAQSSLARFILARDHSFELKPFHYKITSNIDLMLNGAFDRLLITAPPRHGKSEIISRNLPAYYLGKNPNHNIIACSYTPTLASRMNRDVQRIIDSPEYSSIFPDIKINSKNVVTTQSWLRNNEMFEIIDHSGVYRSAGVGSGITGSGMDLGIIDDPIKDMASAMSPTIRKNIWEWYGSTFYTRLSPNGKIIVMHTRWHKDDLAGRLLEQMNDENADQWVTIDLPAIDENGNALWEERYPVQKLMKLKASVGSKVFESLYQQRPSAEEGGDLKRSWWRFYDALPEERLFDQWLITSDPSMTGSEKSDYCVHCLWGKHGSNFYLVDMIRKKMAFTESRDQLHKFWSRHREKGPKVLIENKANGPAIIDSLRTIIPGIVPFNPKSSKEDRVKSISPFVEAGNVWIPNFKIKPWVMEFIDECADFPNAKNDDMVDNLSMALMNWTQKRPSDFPEQFIDNDVETLTRSILGDY